MDNLRLALESGWKVLAMALVMGALLPAVFAVGVRSLAVDGPEQGHGGRTVRHDLVAGACFLVVLVAVVLGITYIVASGFGHKLDFSHGYPTFVEA